LQKSQNPALSRRPELDPGIIATPHQYNTMKVEKLVYLSSKLGGARWQWL